MYYDRFHEIKVPSQNEDACIEFMQENNFVHGHDYSIFVKDEYTIFKYYIHAAYEKCYAAWRPFALLI